jgi:hypothetical protein
MMFFKPATRVGVVVCLCSVRVAAALKTTPAKAEAACRLEEEFQMEQWGLVEGGHDMDRVAGKVNLNSASAFLHLLDGDVGHAQRHATLQAALAKLDNDLRHADNAAARRPMPKAVLDAPVSVEK